MVIPRVSSQRFRYTIYRLPGLYNCSLKWMLDAGSHRPVYRRTPPTCPETHTNTTIIMIVCVIVWMRAVLKRSVVGDWRFSNLRKSHLVSGPLYIPLTNWVRGPYCKLRTKFFPLKFMAQALALCTHYGPIMLDQNFSVYLLS